MAKGKATVADVVEAQEKRGKRKFRTLEAAPVVAFTEVGQQVEGELLRAREVTVKRRRAVIYDLKQDDGSKVSFWGTSYLDTRLADVEPGTYLRITYVADEDVGQESDMRVFKVEAA